MQDISYTSKLIHAEDGGPLALDYYIIANDGEPGRYGVKIIEKNSGEQAMAFDLTTVSFHVTCKTQDGPTFRYARIRENPGTRLNTRFFRGKPLE